MHVMSHFREHDIYYFGRGGRKRKVSHLYKSFLIVLTTL